MRETPREAGYRMPAEWEPHERCWMAWPHRADLWGATFGGSLPDAQEAYAAVARAIAAFEPVTMVAVAGALSTAARLCGPAVEVLPLELDDSWLRDSGPLFLVGPDGARAAAAWRFNAWGGKFDRYARDATVPERLCERLGLPLHRSPLCLEGGALHVDGEGTVLTTESCALNPNRNPGLSRAEVERELCEALGASKVLWLPGELDPDDVTDGHVDGLACFARPGLVLMETRTDPAAPRAPLLAENRQALVGATDARGRSIQVVEMEYAWHAERRVTGHCINYVNFYVANGGVVMPCYGIPEDAGARAAVEKAFPDRRVVQVDVRAIEVGGGGIHCITQQQPA